jgi:cyclase
MRRWLVLGVLIVFGGAAAVRAASQQPAPASASQIEVDKLKDNLYVLKGGGGNTAVFITADGVTVVDAKNPGWGQPILDKIKSITPKPVTRLINTHTHGDHVSGNVEFPATVDIVTQENTKTNMEKMDIFKQNNGKGMPKKTFKDRMTLGSGKDRFELYYFGRGHTNGDAWIVFPELRVVHAGDIFSGKNLPLVDANNGGSALQISDTLSSAANKVKNIDTIITGHSTTMTVADLKEYAEFNKDFANEVRAAKKAGKTVDEVAASWKMPAKYMGYAAPQAARLKANVQIVFDESK